MYVCGSGKKTKVVDEIKSDVEEDDDDDEDDDDSSTYITDDEEVLEMVSIIVYYYLKVYTMLLLLNTYVHTYTHTFIFAYVRMQFKDLSKGKGYITEKALRKWDELQEIQELGIVVRSMYV